MSSGRAPGQRCQVPYPQALLDRVKAARHPKSQRDISPENPVPYVFLVIYDCWNGDKYGGGETISGAYSSLEKANKAALEIFRANHPEYFEIEEDMSNWYYKNSKGSIENEGEEDTVAWDVNSNGEVLVEAQGTDEFGEHYSVRVEAKKLQ
ncbi:hypothetical protein PENARI_c004G07696 [Penicillium arizonense]|uniref:Uncharacterized protein n=1 Tax=Penicillium arizonense TaxID=1835702 RepID=A0A1F5LQR9_PENAI|nr:hypothetical protein PENARI_c004G07696 [Penicillium arizonense]OGE55456.1 hypothetical protein PENARI_c004G07696 [Penicillium arizonense]